MTDPNLYKALTYLNGKPSDLSKHILHICNTEAQGGYTLVSHAVFPSTETEGNINVSFVFKKMLK